MNKICVIGSMNMDLVMNVKNLPKTGETLLVKDLKKIPGGKGSNQAVAAKRLGCEVSMISKIGQDDNGKILLDCLKNDGINTEYIFVDKDETTGLAIITVDEKGDNTIAVVSGANMSMTVDEVKKAEKYIKESKVIIAQFETPIDTTIEAFKVAKKSGVVTILNPAPANKVSDDLLALTDIIIPNETEAFELTGIKVEDLDSAKTAAEKFLEKGTGYVIITLGAKGAALVSKDNMEIIDAYKVEAVDTTAAGDSFIGAISYKLSQEEKINYEIIKSAISFGNKVSSIAVTKKGAQSSLPYLKEVNEKYGEE